MLEVEEAVELKGTGGKAWEQRRGQLRAEQLRGRTQTAARACPPSRPCSRSIAVSVDVMDEAKRKWWMAGTSGAATTIPHEARCCSVDMYASGLVE